MTLSVFNVKGKRVTVIGAARSGIAVANAIVRLGGGGKKNRGEKPPPTPTQKKKK